MRFIPLAALLMIQAAATAMAAPTVDSALKAFGDVGADAERLKTFCAMNRVMNTTGDESDTKAMEAADKEVQIYLEKLGPEFKAAWELGVESDPESPDGTKLNTAIEALENKCDK